MGVWSWSALAELISHFSKLAWWRFVLSECFLLYVTIRLSCSYSEAVMFIVNLYWLYIRSYFVYVAYVSGSTWVNIWSIRWAWKYSALTHTQTQHIRHDHHSKVYFTDEYMYESPGINVITLFEVLHVCRQLESSLLHRMLTVVRSVEQYPKHI